MPASRIFRFARTSRWAMVGSEDRNALAISRVVRPPSVRRVRAIRASIASAGWQQVNTRRRRSSAMLLTASSSSSPASMAASSVRVSVFARRFFSRRSRSMALLRAARVIQAPGFRGRPSDGHLTSATRKASWTASSARSKSPRILISVARTRPVSSRKARSTTSRVTSAGDRAGELKVLRLHPFEFHERPDLDRSTLGGRDPGRGLDGLVDVVALDQVVATELLLGLRERAVGGHGLPVLDPDRGCRVGWLQGVARAHPALLRQPLAEVLVAL